MFHNYFFIFCFYFHIWFFFHDIFFSTWFFTLISLTRLIYFLMLNVHIYCTCIGFFFSYVIFFTWLNFSCDFSGFIYVHVIFPPNDSFVMSFFHAILYFHMILQMILMVFIVFHQNDSFTFTFHICGACGFIFQMWFFFGFDHIFHMMSCIYLNSSFTRFTQACAWKTYDHIWNACDFSVRAISFQHTYSLN